VRCSLSMFFTELKLYRISAPKFADLKNRARQKFLGGGGGGKWTCPKKSGHVVVQVEVLSDTEHCVHRCRY
jgi:hypothetical protein